jgi:hypothetical protein
VRCPRWRDHELVTGRVGEDTARATFEAGIGPVDGLRPVRRDIGKVLALLRSMFGLAADCIDVSTEVATAIGATIRRAGLRAWEVMAGTRPPDGTRFPP